MAEGSDGVFFCRLDFSHQGKEKWTLDILSKSGHSAHDIIRTRWWFLLAQHPKNSCTHQYLDVSLLPAHLISKIQ